MRIMSDFYQYAMACQPIRFGHYKTRLENELNEKNGTAEAKKKEEADYATMALKYDLACRIIAMQKQQMIAFQQAQCPRK